jgi:soluble lytic murein transglycosylase-like protein
MILLGAAIVLAGVFTAQFLHNRQVPLASKDAGITTRWVPQTVRRWDKPINEMAKKYNIDSNLIAIIITLESGGDPKAESPIGAQGLMQVTAPTAKDIAAKFLKEPRQKYNLLDPRTNIEFGAAYLAYLRKEFGTVQQGPSWNNTVELIAAGYNGGPGAANNLEQGKGLRSTETVIYSRDAFNMWRERNSARSPTFERWEERGGSTLLEAAKNN